MFKNTVQYENKPIKDRDDLYNKLTIVWLYGIVQPRRKLCKCHDIDRIPNDKL